MEDNKNDNLPEGIEVVKLPNSVPEEVRGLYSSPCSMSEFDEWKI